MSRYRRPALEEDLPEDDIPASMALPLRIFRAPVSVKSKVIRQERHA